MSKHPKKKDEKRRKRILKEIVVGEVSIVDRPMAAPARVAILKREGYDTSSTLTKRIALTTSSDGHQHTLKTSFGEGEQRTGSTSWQDEHSHEWVMDDSGNIIIAEADDHSHEIALVVMKNDTETLPEMDALAALLKEGEPASGTDKVTNMAENDKGAEGVSKEDFDKVSKSLESAEKSAKRFEAILKLSTEQREYFDEQNDAGKEEFLGKSTEEQTAVLKNAKDSDPVIYKALDGRQLRKSDGENFVAEVKRNDSLQNELAEGRAITKRAGFEKRADSELGHMVGETMAKADLLEAVSMLPEAKQEKVLEILKASDAGVGKAQKTIGSTAGANDDSSVDDQLDAMAKSLAKDEKISFAKAYQKIMKTPEARELWASSNPLAAR